MTDQEEQSIKETKRKAKRAAEEIEQLAKDQARRKAHLAREQAEVGNTASQGTCLTRAGAGNYQEGTISIRHRLNLRSVERI